MRRWLVRLIVTLGLLGWTYVPVVLQPAHVHTQQDPATIVVYVTKTGEKYHRDGCRYLSKSKIAMSLKEAAARYGPCSVCKPPTLSK
jgi:hypothetical protein